MSNEFVIARPYAKAAFDFAKQHDLTQWLKTLAALKELVNSSKIQSVLSDPSLSSHEQLSFIETLTEGFVDEYQKNFLAILAENGRLLYLPSIFALFEHFYDEYKKQIEATVVTPFSLSAQQKASLTETLTKQLKEKVLLHEKIDESLIGGAIIQIGDQVIDGSIKGRLARLATYLGVEESICQ